MGLSINLVLIKLVKKRFIKKFYIRKFIENKEPLKFDKYFKKSFDLITNCQVKEIDETKKYTSIYFDSNFKTYSANSKKLIICVGAIESTLLIMNSIKNNKLKNIKKKKVLRKVFYGSPKMLCW